MVLYENKDEGPGNRSQIERAQPERYHIMHTKGKVMNKQIQQVQPIVIANKSIRLLHSPDGLNAMYYPTLSRYQEHGP